MPATRKSSRAAAAKGTGRQSTLSFNNRVSKAGAAKVSAKEAAILTPPASSSLVKKEGAAVVNPSDEVEVEVGKLEVPDDAEEVVEPEDVTQQEVQKSPVEARAERVTDAQIKKYWREVEAVRIARRVHQEELSLAEKVLRYFDISSQYGVCEHDHTTSPPPPNTPLTPILFMFRAMRRRSMIADLATALYRDSARETVAPCREARPKPAH